MESSPLRSETVRNDLEVFQRRCDSLIAQYEAADSPDEKTRIADEYSQALKQVETVTLLLELVERMERQKNHAVKTSN